MVIGETWTQVFADSMAIAASTLNHCTTLTQLDFIWNKTDCVFTLVEHSRIYLFEFIYVVFILQQP